MTTCTSPGPAGFAASWPSQRAVAAQLGSLRQRRLRHSQLGIAPAGGDGCRVELVVLVDRGQLQSLPRHVASRLKEQVGLRRVLGVADQLGAREQLGVRSRFPARAVRSPRCESRSGSILVESRLRWMRTSWNPSAPTDGPVPVRSCRSWPIQRAASATRPLAACRRPCRRAGRSRPSIRLRNGRERETAGRSRPRRARRTRRRFATLFAFELGAPGAGLLFKPPEVAVGRFDLDEYHLCGWGRVLKVRCEYPGCHSGRAFHSDRRNRARPARPSERKDVASALGSRQPGGAADVSCPSAPAQKHGHRRPARPGLPSATPRCETHADLLAGNFDPSVRWLECCKRGRAACSVPCHFHLASLPSSRAKVSGVCLTTRLEKVATLRVTEYSHSHEMAST